DTQVHDACIAQWYIHQPVASSQPGGKLVANSRLWPAVQGIGGGHLEVVTGLIGAAPQLTGETSRMCAINGVIFQRRRQRGDDQPARREGPLANLDVADRRSDSTPRPVTAARTLPPDPRPAGVRPVR